MPDRNGTVRLDGAQGLWTLEEVQALLEAHGHTVEIQTPLDRATLAPGYAILEDETVGAGVT